MILSGFCENYQNIYSNRNYTDDFKFDVCMCACDVISMEDEIRRFIQVLNTNNSYNYFQIKPFQMNSPQLMSIFHISRIKFKPNELKMTIVLLFST